MISLKPHHSLALEASCKNLITISSQQELLDLSFNHDCFFILGAGTNVAFLEDFGGDVICFTGNAVHWVEHDNSWIIKAGAGKNWHDLVAYTVAKGIGGLENLALIPGSCGAAAVQNIGAYGVEFSTVCKEVKGFDLISKQERTLTNKECHFGYRDSVFKSDTKKSFLINEITLELPKNWLPVTSYQGLNGDGDLLDPLTIMQKVVKLRQSKLPDPSVLPNAGSFFKNPVVNSEIAGELRLRWPKMPMHQLPNEYLYKLSAGWLMENAGLKGLVMKHLGTYEKHALVIVNHGGANGEELLELIAAITTKVYEQFSLKLENEVALVGKAGQVNL